MQKWLQKITQTNDSITLFIIRVTLGFVIFPHGAQKLFGWFGGHGWTWTIDMWHQWWGLPAMVTVLVILAESIGSICLIVGFFGRFMAVSILSMLVGAVYLVHAEWGFFMNWYAEPNRGEGFEFHILAIGIALAVIISGSGKWSLDRMLNKKEIFSDNDFK